MDCVNDSVVLLRQARDGGSATRRCSGSSARARRPSRTPETSPWRPASFKRCMPPAMSPSSGGRRRKSCDGQDPGDDASSQVAIQGADRGGVLGAGMAWRRGKRWTDRHGIRLAAAPAATAVLSVKTHRRVVTGNTRSWEAAGALAGTGPSVNGPDPGTRRRFRTCRACHPGGCERAFDDLPTSTDTCKH